MRTEESVPLRQPPADFLGVVCDFLQLFDDRSPVFLGDAAVTYEA